MRCANKAATESAGRMRAAGEQVNEYSAAVVSSPVAVDNQPATINVAGARGHPRAASLFAALTAGGSPMDVGPDKEVIYSGESDPRPIRSRPQRPAVRL